MNANSNILLSQGSDSTNDAAAKYSLPRPPENAADIDRWYRELAALNKDPGWHAWYMNTQYQPRPVDSAVAPRRESIEVRRRRRWRQRVAAIVRSVMVADLPDAVSYLMGRNST